MEDALFQIQKKDDDSKFSIDTDGTYMVDTTIAELPEGLHYELIDDDEIEVAYNAKVTILQQIFLFNAFLMFIITVLGQFVYGWSEKVPVHVINIITIVIASLVVLLYIGMAILRYNVLIVSWTISIAVMNGLVSRIMGNDIFTQMFTILLMQNISVVIHLLYVNRDFKWYYVALTATISGIVMWLIGIVGYVLEDDWKLAGGVLALTIVFAIYLGLQTKFASRYTGVTQKETYNGLVNFYTDPICLFVECCKPRK